jgi:hypothetical protein
MKSLMMGKGEVRNLSSKGILTSSIEVQQVTKERGTGNHLEFDFILSKSIQTSKNVSMANAKLHCAVFPMTSSPKMSSSGISTTPTRLCVSGKATA